MGKRGPKVGAKYHKRIRVARALPVGTDHELVEAQHFNDRLYAWLTVLERREGFALSNLEPRLVEQAMEATAALQSAVIEGIAAYMLREE